MRNMAPYGVKSATISFPATGGVVCLAAVGEHRSHIILWKEKMEEVTKTIIFWRFVGLITAIFTL